MSTTYNIDQKPNNRSKGKKLGIRTGNTVKFDHKSKEQTTKPTTFQIQTLESALHPSSGYLERSAVDDSNYFVSPNKSVTIKQSINKHKAWEIIEDTNEDPNYVVQELLAMDKKAQKPISKMYTQKTDEPKEKEVEEETTVEIVKGRKGNTIKKHRPPGKKGVKKNNPTDGGPKETEAEFVVYVHKTQPKNEGKVYQQMESNYHDSYGNKNRKHKQRKENSNSCQL